MEPISIDLVQKELRQKSENGRVKFASGMLVHKIDKETIGLHISETGVNGNMQRDDAAFEGWLLALRSLGMWGDAKYILSWDIPRDINGCHYQRFLYRALRFHEYFSDWIAIEENSLAELSKNCTIMNSPDRLCLNVPLREASIVDVDMASHAELQLEQRFSSGEGQTILNRVSGCNLLGRQLPVGLFKESPISSGNRIFTGGKSAIDLWGHSKESDSSDEIHIFELKGPKNTKVGILSELMFYSFIINDIRKGFFKFNDPQNIIRGPIEKIVKAKKTKAWMLAPKLHPLITKSVISLMNKGLKDHSTSYGFISFDPDTLKCECVIP